MSESLSQLCNLFEIALLGNGNASARNCLHMVSVEVQPELLFRLLQIELHHLLKNGQKPSLQKYRRLYPEFVAVVEKAFDNVVGGGCQHVPYPLGELAAGRESSDAHEHSLPPEVPSAPAPAPPTMWFTAVRRPLQREVASASAADASHRCSVVLTVTEGPSAGQELRFFDHQSCIVGRSRQAQLRLSPNPQFSRFHCRLEIRPPEAVVMDLGSTNGTKVNGKRVCVCALKDGDEVAVGDVKLTVSVQDRCSPGATPTVVPVQGRMSPADAECCDAPLPNIPGYIVERCIGHGSMGDVYLARRVASSAMVAIKLVRPLVSADQRMMVRFQREASIVLRLQHRRIVRSLDFRMGDGHCPYLVMEYIDDVKPHPILAKAPVRERCRMAAGILVRVLEGLQYAHEMEIVHRDLKPSNLLFFYAGRKLQVKIADFGLAKNFVDAGFSNFSTNNEICGTLAFMPPEQIVDCRYAKPGCDIYAAGVCLYNLISDRFPFEAETVAEQISLILNKSPIPIDSRVPGIAPGLAALISRAMAREPRRRFASAADMRAELLPFTKRKGTS